MREYPSIYYIPSEVGMKRFQAIATLILVLVLAFTGLSAPSAIAADPPPGGCGANAYWNGNSCVANPTPPPTTATTTTATFNCNGAQIPVGAYCPPATTTAPNTQTQPAITCPAGSFYDQGIQGCKSSTSTGTTTGAMGTGTGIVCTPAMGPPACPAQTSSNLPQTTTSPAGGLNCMNGMVPNPQGTACIAPVVGTTTAQGQTDCSVPANQALTACGGTTAMPNTGTAASNCPNGFFFDVTLQGCKSVTAGPAATDIGSTTNASGCMAGMVRDGNGVCIAPVVSSGGQIDCSAAANKVTTACGGNIAIQNSTPNAANNNWINCGVGFFYDEGTKGCKSTGAAGGVVNQVATIKCKDGSVRVTATECDNVGGGSAGVAISCPSNQVPSPSGAYCIYPSTGGTNANAGTYRAECAANPPPASCLGQTVNTFEGNATMAKAANFTAYDANALQIKNGVALNENGRAIGQLAKTSSGQSFAVAAPPPPPAAPSTGGKKPAPAPKKKASTAPVILLNVTDANGDEIKDSSGKALTTAPVVKKGNFVFSDRNGKPVMATPTLDQSGKPVEYQGKVLFTKLVTIAGQEALTDADGNAIMAVPLLDENGKPLIAKNGEVLYAPPLTNAFGETIINQKTNQPVLASPMADADGNAALGANKKPFMGQPILNGDNQVLTVAGQPVYTGAAGMPVTTSKLQQVRSAQGQDLQFAFGGTLIDEGGNTVLGPDGRPTILSVNATPLMANGLPLVDKNGKACRVNNKGQVTDSSGRLILGTDGKPMALGKWETFEPVRVGAAKTKVKDPTGKTAVLGLNAQLFDSKGNPIVTATGAPVYFDGRTKSLIDNKGKAIKVDGNGRVPGKIATLAFQTVTFAA